jgi:hypothetical protein
MRRPFTSRSLAILLTGAALLLGSLALAGPATAATKIATTTTCGNAVGGGGGQGLICRVTVVNRITASGGSARVTVRECLGSAGVPAPCKTTVTNLTKPVTHVTQCNGSVNGGGATLRCSVQVINNFVGLSTGATRATVIQCVGSGSVTSGCDPFPATTTGATITQCNGSAGGGTLVQLTCTATGTKPSAHGVLVNQCNGSANGGGALVICSTNISNRRIAGASTGGTGGSTATPTSPATDTIAASTDVRGPAPTPVLYLGICFLAFVLAGRRLLAIRNR